VEAEPGVHVQRFQARSANTAKSSVRRLGDHLRDRTVLFEKRQSGVAAPPEIESPITASDLCSALMW
jgi:hypothetical protein